MAPWISADDFKADRAVSCPCMIVARTFVGTTSYDQRAALHNAPCHGHTGRALSVERQPDNAADKNAVRVFGAGRACVGYVNRDIAAVVAPLMDAGCVAAVTIKQAAMGSPPKAGMPARVSVMAPAAVQRQAHIQAALRRLRCLARAAEAACTARAGAKRPRATGSPRAPPDDEQVVFISQTCGSMAGVSRLPGEVWAVVLGSGSFGVRDWATARTVCKEWRDVIDAPHFAPWRKLAAMALHERWSKMPDMGVSQGIAAFCQPKQQRAAAGDTGARIPWQCNALAHYTGSLPCTVSQFTAWARKRWPDMPSLPCRAVSAVAHAVGVPEAAVHAVYAGWTKHEAHASRPNTLVQLAVLMHLSSHSIGVLEALLTSCMLSSSAAGSPADVASCAQLMEMLACVVVALGHAGWERAAAPGIWLGDDSGLRASFDAAASGQFSGGGTASSLIAADAACAAAFSGQPASWEQALWLSEHHAVPLTALQRAAEFQAERKRLARQPGAPAASSSPARADPIAPTHHPWPSLQDDGALRLPQLLPSQSAIEIDMSYQQAGEAMLCNTAATLHAYLAPASGVHCGTAGLRHPALRSNIAMSIVSAMHHAMDRDWFGHNIARAKKLNLRDMLQSRADDAGISGAELDSACLTIEQRAVVTMPVPERGVVRVAAYAGAGKSTCLLHFARQHPERRILYLVFNRSVRESAQLSFPEWTHCSTVHALAYKATGWTYAHKMGADLSAYDVQVALGLSSDVDVSEGVLNTLMFWMLSGCDQLAASHVQPPLSNLLMDWSAVPALSMAPADVQCRVAPHLKAEAERKRLRGQPARITSLASALRAVQLAWALVIDKDNTGLRMFHSAYLKLWAMSKPCLSSIADVVLVDEAQDLAAVVTGVLARTAARVPVICVGDTHQNIYGFLNSANLMARGPLPHDMQCLRELRLSRTFRFGGQIAHLANALLRWGKGEPVPVLPHPPVDDAVRCAGGLPPVLSANDYPALHNNGLQVASDCPLLPRLMAARRLGHWRRRLHGRLPSTAVPQHTDHDGLRARWRVALLSRSNHVLASAALALAALELLPSAPVNPQHPAFTARHQATPASASPPVTGWRHAQIHWAGGGIVGVLDTLEAMALLKAGDVTGARAADKLIGSLGSAAKLGKFLSKPSRQRRYAWEIEVLERQSPQALVAAVQAVRACSVASAEQADVVLSTVHRAKGLEFEEVVLAGSWGIPLMPYPSATRAAPAVQQLTGTYAPCSAEELNILYVAVTRARIQLWLNAALLRAAIGSGCWCRPAWCTARSCVACAACGHALQHQPACSCAVCLSIRSSSEQRVDCTASAPVGDG